MKISEMILSNFRLFRYDQKLEIPTDGDRPLIIVRAENRTGKTTLLTALQWCFYGDRVLTSAKQSLSGGDLLVSADALRDAKHGDDVKTQVAVRFDHKGKEYIAKRIRETKRGESENDSIPVGADIFTIMRLDPTGANLLPNPAVFMEQLLPDNLRELFLFDGDRINRFMEPDHEEAVQKAVSDMLEFELFDEARRHLTQILKEYRTQLRDAASGEAKRLRDEHSQLSEELEAANEKHSQTEAELRAERAMEQELTSEIAASPGDAGAIQQQVNSLREQIESKESAENELASELGRQLGGGQYFTISPFIDKARQLLREKKAAGEIPKRIGEDLIKERLELGLCICGRPLAPGDTAHEHLMAELTGQKDRAAFDELATEELYFLNALSRRNADDLSKQLNETLSRRVSYQQAVLDLGRKITELDTELEKVDGDSIGKTRTALTETRKRIEGLLTDTVLRNQRISELGEKLAELRRRLIQAERADKRNRALRLRETLAEDCLNSLTLTYQKVRDIERVKISERTEDIFFRMNVRQDEFQRVEVTPTFQLQVIAPGGNVVNAVLSGAQRRALSLSFLFALMQVSERDAPVVVDTPLGMTSGPMRRSITEAMIAQTGQLILLLTRSEIQGVEDILSEGASEELTLTCSHDYPKELRNPPRLEGAYTEVCECGIQEACKVCERLPDKAEA